MKQGCSDLRYGRIVYAWIADRNGYKKLRPAIVLTDTSGTDEVVDIVVIAISTTFPEPPPDNCVLLPWHPAGRSRTELRKRSAAVVDWLAILRDDDIVALGGLVPEKTMRRIQEKLAELS